MNDVEVGNLIVRLMADIAGFKKDMQDVVENSKKTADAVEANTKKIEESGNKIKEYGKLAVEGLTVIAESRFFKDSLEKFEETEKGMIRLRAAISVTGGNVDELSEKYVKFAKAQAQISLSSKNEIIALEQQALAAGLTEDAIERVVKQSQALGALKGQSPESFMRGVIALNRPKKDADDEDHTEQLFRMLAGRSGTGVQDKFAQLEIIQKNITAGEKALIETAKTSSEEMKRLGKIFGDIKMEAGGMIAEGIKPLILMLKDMADIYKGLDPQLKKFIASIGALGGATLIATSTWKLLNTVGLIPAIVSTYKYFFATGLATTAQIAQNAALEQSNSQLKMQAFNHRKSVAQTALWTAGIVGAIYGLAKLGESLTGFNKEREAFDEGLKKSIELNDILQNSIKQGQQQKIQKGEGLKGDDQVQYFVEERKRALNELEQINKNIVAQESVIAEKDGFFRKAAADFPIGGGDPEMDLLKARLEELKKTKKTYSEYVDEISKITSKLGGDKLAATSQDQKHATDSIKHMRDQIAVIDQTSKAYDQLNERGVETFRAMESEYKKLYEALNKHVEPAILNQMNKQIQDLYISKGKIKLTEDLMDLEKELNKTIYTFGATADAIKLYELAQRSAEFGGGPKGNEALSRIKELMKTVEEMEKLKKIMDFGKSTTEANQTPIEKYEEEVNKLNNAVRNGAMTYDIYSRAIGKAKAELDKLMGSEQGIVGVLAGSKDAKMQEISYLKMRYEINPLPVQKEEAGLKPTPNLLLLKERQKMDALLPGLHDKQIERANKEKQELDQVENIYQEFKRKFPALIGKATGEDLYNFSKLPKTPEGPREVGGIKTIEEFRNLFPEKLPAPQKVPLKRFEKDTVPDGRKLMEEIKDWKGFIDTIDIRPLSYYDKESIRDANTYQKTQVISDEELKKRLYPYLKPGEQPSRASEEKRLEKLDNDKKEVIPGPKEAPPDLKDKQSRVETLLEKILLCLETDKQRGDPTFPHTVMIPMDIGQV